MPNNIANKLVVNATIQEEIDNFLPTLKLSVWTMS